jgi:hypothetical protein
MVAKFLPGGAATARLKLPLECRKMFCQGAYIWFSEGDSFQFWSKKFHQHIIVSSGIETNRNISGLVGFVEEYATQ